jgi:hypothetical protein
MVAGRNNESGTTLVQTVTKKKSKFTERLYKRAEAARQVQNIIGRPPLQRYLEIIDKRMLINCPVTREDVLTAEKIFGPNLGGLKGRTTRRSSPESDDIVISDVPPEILQLHGKFTLAIDIMQVNSMSCLVTISKGIKFGTVSHLPDKKQPTLVAALKRIFHLYGCRGFQVVLVKGDHEFEALRPDMEQLKIVLNTTARDEHVPKIEPISAPSKSGLALLTMLSHSSIFPVK